MWMRLLLFGEAMPRKKSMKMNNQVYFVSLKEETESINSNNCKMLHQQAKNFRRRIINRKLGYVIISVRFVFK